MAGYTKIYCLGGLGGFMGTDGLNPIVLQIWVGEGSRQWYEAHYFNKDIEPIGNISRIIPEKPDDMNALLDCCIAFLPTLFEDCLSLASVKEELKDCTFMDFDTGKNIPANWNDLRKEGQKYLNNIAIFEADLRQIFL